MKLELSSNNRLYTYKVAYDSGTAPNPDFNTCTLAICKPAIRRTAKVGDIIVGFDCLENQDRIIYCMQVDEVLTWSEYVARCEIDQSLNGKIPKNQNDAGDCIWVEERFESYEPLPSWSWHGRDEFYSDVLTGKNVLLGKKFWYFGKGDKYEIRLPEKLLNIIPNRGHRSNSNDEYKEAFITFFNMILDKEKIPLGKNGTPKNAPKNQTEQKKCS
ncbi:hypothetical protein [Eikenella longinqua]|uniref:Nmad2 family putative nucleotide modification protein n=1 Tax=Eikenella longinqua TaxID=1795827 RepID=UPI000B0C5F72|nr:hypothetical protein [Eikenella longinqua]